MTTSDPYHGKPITLDAPATDGFQVAKDDANDLTVFSRALYVGVGGNVHVTTVGNNELLLEAVLAGSIIPLRCRRVWATGTTADKIVALY